MDKLEEALDRATSNIVVTADARAVTSAIDAALQNADSAVQIIGEADALTAEITAAVEAADTGVIVTGDASELTGEVTAAVDAGDSQVTITGDASELTGDVTAAVDAGDSQVTITADTSQARAEVLQLGQAADEAAGGASRLKQALAGLGAAAIAKGLFDAASAASDLAESTSKATAVFGPATDDIVSFAREAAVNLGLSEQAALEAAGTFGNLFQALGVSQDAAAELSPQILTLAADLASFNNLGVDETLEKIRSGLVGEIEPLRGLGISFGAAEVEARAFELGLQDASGALSEGAKLQARYSLIVEQSSIATGDFARTSGGLANQQRILTAEFQNAVAAAGQELLPTLLALVAMARDELIPQFGELAETVFPAVAGILTDLAPIVGVTLDLLILLAPVIEAVGTAIGAIPEPLLTAAGGLLLFNKAFGGLGGLLNGSIGALKLLPAILGGTASALPAAASGAGGLATGITGLASGFAALNPLVLGAGVLAVGLFANWQRGREEARAYQRELDELGGSLETLDGFQQLTTAGLAKYIEEQSRINAKDQIEDLGKLGISFTQVANYAQQGAKGQLQFIDALERGGDITKVYRNEFGELVTATGEVIDANSDLGKSVEDVGFGQLAVGATDLVKSYEEIAQVTDDVSKRQIESLQAQGLLTDAQVREALAVNDSGEATRSYAEALNLLEPQVVAAARAAQATIDAYGPLAAQFIGTADALERLRDEAPGVASEIQSLRTGAEDSDSAFLNLALSIGAAELSEEAMGDAAALLGTDVETLTGIVESAAEALDTFVDTASGQLPTLADAFSNVGENSVLSVREFVSALEESTASIETFRTNLAILAYAGFSDIAGIIAEQGPEVGGALAQELVTALQTGNVEVLETVREATNGFTAEWTATSDFFRDVIGPEFILQSGLLGAGLSDAFGSNLTFAERIRIAAALAKSGLTTEGQAIAAIAATEGAQAARDYGTALNLDEKTVTEAIRAGEAIKTNAPTGAAKTAGTSVGLSFAQGVGQGIINGSVDADKAAQLLVRNAKAAADAEANAQSPSRLFAELGQNLALGVAVGIAEETESVIAEAEGMIAAVAAAVASSPAAELTIAPAVLDPETIALASLDAAATAAGITGGTGDVSLTVAAGAVVVSFTGAVSDRDARRVGAAVLDGIVDAAAQRQIAVDLRASVGANG